MLLYELYKVLNGCIKASIYNRIGDLIYFGYLDDLDVDILQNRVVFLTPASNHEIVIKLDI